MGKEKKTEENSLENSESEPVKPEVKLNDNITPNAETPKSTETTPSDDTKKNPTEGEALLKKEVKKDEDDKEEETLKNALNQDNKEEKAQKAKKEKKEKKNKNTKKSNKNKSNKNKKPT